MRFLAQPFVGCCRAVGAGVRGNGAGNLSLSARSRILVPLAAAARTTSSPPTIAAVWVADDWGAEQLVVENKPGAGTVLAAQTLLGSQADGYTLMFNTASFPVHARTSLPSKPFDFRTNSLLSACRSVPHVIVVSDEWPAGVAELVAWIKSHDGKAPMPRLATALPVISAREILLRRLGVPVVHVPYRGNAPALTDVLAAPCPI